MNSPDDRTIRKFRMTYGLVFVCFLIMAIWLVMKILELMRTIGPVMGNAGK